MNAEAVVTNSEAAFSFNLPESTSPTLWQEVYYPLFREIKEQYNPKIGFDP
jgi:hypothetical protein